MNRTLAVVLWALAWVVGAVVIGGLAAAIIPGPYGLIASIVGGFAWGYYWTTVLFERVLRT